MALRLPSCEPQAPTVDLKVTFLNPAKQRAGAQVRRDTTGRSWRYGPPSGGLLPDGLLMALLSGSLKGNCRVVSSDLKQSFREFCW